MQTQSPTAEGWQLAGNSAEAYERYLASNFVPWAYDLITRADVAEGDRVLDVACGTGIVARLAARKVGASGTVVGLDVNDDMLAVARASAVAEHQSIAWRQGDAANLPFETAAFDVVLCELALGFFSRPAKALAEMRRVLAPGGRAAVSVCRPVRYSPVYVTMASALAQHVSPEAGAMMRSPFSPWDVGQLRALFVEAGFPDVKVRIEVARLRYPSVEEFLRREAASSPLAGPIGALTAMARTRLVGDLRDALSDHVDDEGVVCPLQIYVALARCGES